MGFPFKEKNDKAKPKARLQSFENVFASKGTRGSLGRDELDSLGRHLYTAFLWRPPFGPELTAEGVDHRHDLPEGDL